MIYNSTQKTLNKRNAKNAKRLLYAFCDLCDILWKLCVECISY